ncbi:hypothetical protein TorRG33x02_319280, partial [Trema orientale]
EYTPKTAITINFLSTMQHALSKRVFLSFFSPLSNDFTYLFSFFFFKLFSQSFARNNKISYHIIYILSNTKLRKTRMDKKRQSVERIMNQCILTLYGMPLIGGKNT